MGESAERQQPNHMENFLRQDIVLIHWCLNDKDVGEQGCRVCE